jgi:FAD/FMN-containing dehydrogenase
MEAITGAARRVPEESASFGLREAGWNVSAIAVWDDPRNDADAIAWARDVVDTLAPFSVNGGGYVNYIPPDETPERVFAAYGAERFTRLAAVKRRYDPDNRLRFNLNIPPA